MDVVVEGDDYVIYVEAKLLSVNSLATSYDPDRTRLVRNVDCVLEQRGDCQPLFCMPAIATSLSCPTNGRFGSATGRCVADGSGVGSPR